MRILAKGFNIEEARQYRLQVIQRRDYESGDTVYWLGEMQFKDGYQIRDASLRGLMPNVKPTYDELQKFHAAKIKDGQGGEDADPNELYDETLKDAAALEEADDGDLTASKACARFSRGDNVIVVKGDLKNLVGTITKIDEAKGLVEIKPEHEELTDLLDIDALQVEKYFSVGNHVKVVRGKYEGSTGMVVNVKDNIASVFSDVTQEEMKVFLRDLMDCTEVTHGMTKFGDMYNLLDLVQLDDMSTGVIVSVEKEACRVLTNKTTGFGQEVRTCRLQNIMRKIHASKLTGLDVFNNIINSGDIVKILQGDWKGKTGTVKHVAKHNYIFVECRDVLQNLGIICVKAKSCNVVGGEKGYNGGAAANQQGAGARDQRSTGARKSFRSLQRDSPLIGKSITVRSGPYKRYRGKVVDANDRTVRLELEAQCKVVTVQHSQLSEGDQGILRGSFHTPAVADVYTPATVQSSGGAGRYGPLGSMAAPGSKTPMHMGGVYGSQTPNPYAAGSQTPNPYAAGSQTPNPYGSQTPAKTPVRERDGGFSIGTPFRVTEDENPSGYNATASFRNQMKASQVDPNLLMNVVLYSENMKQYGKVINIMARENQVTLQLGSYSAGGFESSGLTEDLSLQDLQLAKPVRNGQVRIVTGENKQKGDEYCTFMQEFEDDGTALVRALGDQATVNIVQIQNLAYVLT
jgi:transcription elongation factor SPT5